MDACYDDGTINLILKDIVSQEIFTIDQQIKCTGDQLKWILINMDYLVEELNYDTIKSYCGSCKDAKENSIADSNHRKLNNDQLEYDF